MATRRERRESVSRVTQDGRDQGNPPRHAGSATSSFSPTDPKPHHVLHEGTWHEVDRVWTIHADGTARTKIHTRTMTWRSPATSSSRPTAPPIWYDLQTPRGQDFWLGGYRVADGKRTWYHLLRDEWSVHFNVFPDGRLFGRGRRR